MNLNELEAEARAASDARAAEQAQPVHDTDGLPSRKWVELAIAAREALSDFWEAACDPDTILHLIERVRAGEELYVAIYEHQRESCSSQYDDFTEVARRWESLAHSPRS